MIIKKMSGGYDLTVLYLVLTALMMWLKYILFPGEIAPMSILYVLAAGAAIGLSCGA